MRVPRVRVAPQHVGAMEPHDPVVKGDAHKDALFDEVPTRARRVELERLCQIGSECTGQTLIHLPEPTIERHDVCVRGVREVVVDRIDKVADHCGVRLSPRSSPHVPSANPILAMWNVALVVSCIGLGTNGPPSRSSSSLTLAQYPVDAWVKLVMYVNPLVEAVYASWVTSDHHKRRPSCRVKSLLSQSTHFSINDPIVMARFVGNALMVIHPQDTKLTESPNETAIFTARPSSDRAALVLS